MVCPRQLICLGRTLLEQGDYEQAAKLAAAGVDAHPEDGRLWEMLGVALHRLDEHAGAVDALETATLLKPLVTGARYALAGSYDMVGRREMSVFLYRMVAEDDQTPLCLLPKVASRLGQMEEYSAALDVCRLVVLRNPEHHEAHFGQAFYLRRLGAARECVAVPLGRAHDLAPHVALYRVFLAVLRQEQGRTEEACELLTAVPLEEVHCPESLRRMMTIFYAGRDQQRGDECARCLRRIESLDDLGP